MLRGDLMPEILSVKQVAKIYSRSEEHVKRWCRTGKFPNAKMPYPKKGWQIPVTDVENDRGRKIMRKNVTVPLPIAPEAGNGLKDELRELVILVFQVGTLRTPTEEQINFCLSVDLKQLLEAMLVVRQSWDRINNFDSYVRDAVTQGWSARTTPKKVEKKKEKVERKQSTGKPIRTEQIPDWYHKREEDSKPVKRLSINELSTEELKKLYEVSLVISELGYEKEKERLVSIREELAKRGESI
jgi:hypothetical protein